MKSLAYKDLSNPRNIYYLPKTNKDINKLSLFEPKRHKRNITLLGELEHVGNIGVYLIKGNKVRFLFKH